MQETITISRVTRNNAELLETITDEVFDYEIDAQLLTFYLDSAGHLMVVAVCDNLVVGQLTAYVHRHPDQAPDVYIDNLGVVPLSSDMVWRDV